MRKSAVILLFIAILLGGIILIDEQPKLESESEPIPEPEPEEEIPEPKPKLEYNSTKEHGSISLARGD